MSATITGAELNYTPNDVRKIKAILASSGNVHLVRTVDTLVTRAKQHTEPPPTRLPENRGSSPVELGQPFMQTNI